MKRHTTIIICVLAFIATFLVGCSTLAEQVKQPEETKKPEPLVIDAKEMNKQGLITVYDDETGEVYLEYYGDINIRDEGHEVKVEIHLPSTDCSCDVSDVNN